jgi:hypothetical protein
VNFGAFGASYAEMDRQREIGTAIRHCDGLRGPALAVRPETKHSPVNSTIEPPGLGWLKMIRMFALLWLTLLAALPDTAHAMGTARELANDCRSLLHGKAGAGKEIRIPFTKKALVCWGYMQAMQDLSVLTDEDGRRIMGACPPSRTTLLELIEAFVSYTRSHELPDNAALGVTRALQEAFPCGAHREPP